jgi:hypothetical protein
MGTGKGQKGHRYPVVQRVVRRLSHPPRHVHEERYRLGLLPSKEFIRLPIVDDSGNDAIGMASRNPFSP